MTTVTGTIQQTICYEEYIPGPCTCGQCWHWTQVGSCGTDWASRLGFCCNSCPEQPVCCKLDSATCPIIDDAFLGAEWANTTNNTGLVNCMYDATKITTIQGLNTWINNFGGPGTSQYNNIIMPNFCAIPGDTNCQIDPDTGKPMENCSRLTATDQLGAVCANWCLLSGNEDLCNGTMTTYCSANDTPDCGCVSRSNNPVYQEVKPDLGFGVPDGCWYTPCTGGNLVPYMVPSTVVPAPGTCPQNICTQINTIINSGSGSINIGEAQQVIDCPLNNTTTNGGSTFFTNNKDVVIIIIIIVAVIILAIIIGIVIIF